MKLPILTALSQQLKKAYLSVVQMQTCNLVIVHEMHIETTWINTAQNQGSLIKAVNSTFYLNFKLYISFKLIRILTVK